ncbi:MAG: TRAP transporter substrate-binding protein DctP [Burkholderiaceae bacterium]|nr:TRAP transporter substrate-binding protein DctP [Burkholderiaceae bacterium]
MKTTTKVLGLAAFAALAGGYMPKSAQAAETILFNCFFPPQHYVCRRWLPHMAKEIAAATDGRVKMRIPPKSLAAPPDQYDAVVNGVADGALQFNAFIANKVPGIQVGQLPFIGIQNAEAPGVALWRTYQKFFASKNEYGPVELLTVYASNGAEFYSMTDKPIESIADISGRKMWVLPGIVANLVKRTGSPVVVGPAVQMLEVISKGVVDGYVGVPISSVHNFKLTSYTKSITLLDRKVFTPTFSFFVNKKKWAKISKKDQAAIKAVTGEKMARWFGQDQDKEFVKGREKVLSAGVKEVQGSASFLGQLDALGRPAYDAWKKRVAAMGVDGDAVIEYYQAQIAAEMKKIKK